MNNRLIYWTNDLVQACDSLFENDEQYQSIAPKKKNAMDAIRERCFKGPGSSSSVIDRTDKLQFLFNSTTLFPYIEEKMYDEVKDLSFTDVMIEAAKQMAATGKTIDLLWSGGLDSTSILLALNEICPKQLRVIIGGYTEYPALYEKLVKHLDHTISTDIYTEAYPDKHIFCGGSEGDPMFGAIAIQKNLYKITENEKWNIVNSCKSKWNMYRRFSNGNKDFRFIHGFAGSKIDVNNYMPAYMIPIVEKWIVKHFLLDNMEYHIYAVWKDFKTQTIVCDTFPDYRKIKTPMRDHIFSFTNDYEYCYNTFKTGSGIRMMPLLKNHNLVIGITADGDIIRRSNIHEFNMKDYLNL